MCIYVVMKCSMMSKMMGKRHSYISENFSDTTFRGVDQWGMEAAGGNLKLAICLEVLYLRLRMSFSDIILENLRNAKLATGWMSPELRSGVGQLTQDDVPLKRSPRFLVLRTLRPCDLVVTAALGSM